MIPGVFMVIHGPRLVFQVSLFLSWASEAQSETLRAPQKVPVWSLSWPHDPARQALPVVGRLWPSEDGDGGGGEDDNKVEEGGQVLLRCNPGGACLKNGCTWTFPGMRNKIWLLFFALDNGHHLFTNILQPTSHVVQYHLLLIAASRSPSHLSQMGRSVSWRSTPGRPTAVFPAVIKTLGGTTTTGGQRRPSTREILISSSHPIVLIILFELLRNNSLLIQLFLHRYFQTILNVFTSCFFEFAIYSSSGSACSILISNAKARHAGRYFPWRQIWSVFINSKSDKIEVL